MTAVTQGALRDPGIDSEPFGYLADPSVRPGLFRASRIPRSNHSHHPRRTHHGALASDLGRTHALSGGEFPHRDPLERISHCKTYKGREGHCRVPQSYRENGFRLGGWVSLQRGNRDRMSAERRQQLDTLGFIWAALPNKWEEGFSRLKAYKEREGDCRVRALHVENGFRLGSWVGVQRGNRHRMSGERRQRLDKLGFVWDILRYQWGEGFSYLQAFKKREGHCRVAALHIENGFRLGSWVSLQRGN